MAPDLGGVPASNATRAWCPQKPPDLSLTDNAFSCLKQWERSDEHEGPARDASGPGDSPRAPGDPEQVDLAGHTGLRPDRDRSDPALIPGRRHARDRDLA